MKTFTTFGMAVVAAAVLSLLAPSAHAAFDCSLASASLDGDGDGIMDADECNGLVLPVCTGTETAGSTARAACADPATKDVYVLFNPPLGQSPNWPSADTVLSIINKAAASGGLGVTAHAIAASKVDPSTRKLTATVAPYSTQKVVRVTENLATGTGILGVCEWGTPNGLDDCTVYTQRAISVASSYKFNSTDVIRWVINHETGHAMNLTAANDPQRGHHEPAGSGYVMEESLTSKSGVPGTFSGQSRTDTKLK